MTYKTRFQFLFDQAADIAQAAVASKPAASKSVASKSVASKCGRSLPPLFFVTDPTRTPRPEVIAIHLPRGTGIIYRHFGEPDAMARARRLKHIADEKSLLLMIGDDLDLALEVGALGLHLPERGLDRAEALRQAHPDLRLTSACHSSGTLDHPAIAAGCVDAVFISPVFVSQSASAKGVQPLGVSGVKDLVARSAVPVCGLGGINDDTIGRLHESGLAGVAAVDAFSLGD